MPGCFRAIRARDPSLECSTPLEPEHRAQLHEAALHDLRGAAQRRSIRLDFVQHDARVEQVEDLDGRQEVVAPELEAALRADIELIPTL